MHDRAMHDPAMSTPRVRVIALGNPMASDDGAAMEAARRVAHRDGVEIVLAGRPGAGLLDLLDPSIATVLVDVIRLGARAGSVVEMALADVPGATIDREPITSHGFGVAQALELAQVLDRPLPRGIFVGVGGRVFDPGTELSADVAGAVEDLVTAVEAAVDALLAT
jgi:hydrogenase maturation protease